VIQTQGSLARGLAVGDRAVVSRTFGESDVVLFGGLTHDLNPYHFDAEFARRARFGRPIVHGLLVASMLTHVGGQWAWLASAMSFEFLAPVFLGDTVTLEVEIRACDERGRFRAEARFANQDGAEVMRGSLEGFPPREQELELLTRQGALTGSSPPP
jgi:3-hydroxybutyryl-CoA dehydratase